MIKKKPNIQISIINGCNLNLLGAREADHYGIETLEILQKRCLQWIQPHAHISLDFTQSNHEGDLIDYIQSLQSTNILLRYVIINPGAFTHTSVGIRDALLSMKLPFIEVHISNIHQRETFRHHSYFSDIAMGTISGLGTDAYLLAIQKILFL